MRTATSDTRRALRAAIGDGPARSWATAHNVAPVDVSDCLNERPMSARRENRIRVALGLTLLRWQTVELLEGQRVVTCSKPVKTKRRASTMTPEEALQADKLAQSEGYRSFGQMAVDKLLRHTM